MLTALRQSAYETLRAGLPANRVVHQFLPDEIGPIPFVAVGRPGLDISDQLPGAWQADLNIYVIGNRIQGAKHQAEHDDLADEVVAVLRDSKPVPPMVECGMASVTAAVTPIAGTDYPAYIVRFVGYTTIDC